jgi:hypothetical protein
MYDNALGRFYGMDALSEKNHYLSPFQFGNGNPVFWADPSGLSAVYNWDDGQYYLNGKVVDFEAAMASYGLDVSGNLINQTIDAGGSGGGGAAAGGGGGNVNVVLFILNPSENLNLSNLYNKHGYTGWKFEFAKNIQHGLELISKYGKIDNFVLYFHADGGELNMGSYDSEFENVVNRNSIGSYTLSLFNAKSKEEFLAEGFSEQTYNDILAFSKISNKVNTNGTFIIPGCNIGSSSLFIEHIIKTGKLENHDVYFNEGYGRFKFSTIKDNFSIKSERSESSNKSIINIKRGQEYIFKDLFINRNNNIPLTLLK